MLIRGRSNTDQGGAVLITFAISAIVILGFMALAVDGAHAFVQRRDSQATADVSAIAGSFTLLDNDDTDAQKEATLVAEVKRVAAQNLGPDLDWDGCTDPNRPAIYATVASDTACISWSFKFRQVRVKIPDRQIPTFFGRAIGFDTITATAAAEVGVIVDGGAVLPLGLLAGNTEGLQCGKTGSQANDECERNASGNFQYLDFTRFGSISQETQEQCSGDSVGRITSNLARGIDHFLTLAPSSPTDASGIIASPAFYRDRDECEGIKRDANAVVTQTGNVAGAMTEGLITGSDPLARLKRGSLDQSVDFDGHDVDDTPIWNWFTQTALDTCEETNSLSSDPLISTEPEVDTETEAIRCIDELGTAEMFDPDIQFSPRLALVPELHQSAWPSGGKYVSFKSFTFVYIQGVFGNCNEAKGTCDTVFIPGEPDRFKVKKGNANITAMSVIGIPDIALPQAVRDYFLDPEYDTYVLIR